MTGLLLDTELTAEQAVYVAMLREASDALLGLAGDFLDFARLEAGALSLDLKPMDLRACLESAVDLLAVEATRRGLDLTLEIDPQAPPYVLGDAARLRQVLVNLLDNAVKFTHHGEVHLAVEALAYEPGRFALHFQVRDTGIGIAPERMGELFLPFRQIDPGAAGGRGGAGLGLAISAQLATLLGGKLWAESEPGRGSTFHLRLPAESARDDRWPSLVGPQPQFRGRRVLVVDDNANNRRILRRVLTSWGAAVRDAAGAAEALAMLDEGAFDLAILDMQMPGVDGLSLARRMRAMGRAEPLVLLSSLGTPEERVAEIGFRAVLTKPVKFGQLFAVLGPIFEHSDGAAPSGGRAEARRMAPVLAARRPCRILVVEDDELSRRVTGLTLARLGYQAELAADGLECLARLEGEPFDLVLLDLQLPLLDGLATARRIRDGERARPGGGRTFLAALTAAGGEPSRRACLEAGMDAFLTKPLSPAALMELIRRCAAPEPPAAAPEPSALAQVRDRLIHLLGADEPAVLAELVETYLKDCDARMAILREGLAAGGPDEALAEQIHALKGCHSNLGLEAFAALCADAESVLRGHPDAPARRALVEGLASAYVALRSQLAPVAGARLGTPT